jgi:hypothetical protein
MEPRYKVLATYPGSPFSVKEVYSVGEILQEDFAFTLPREIDQYPHLFYKMQWWEERKDEDLPPYLRIFDVVWKVDKWAHGIVERQPIAYSDSEKGRKDHFLSVTWYFNKANSLPATQEEYEHYLSTQKQETK